jgi:hypothetical protein
VRDSSPRLASRGSSGKQCQVSHRQETDWREAYAPGVRAHRLWPGFLAIFLLLCIGVGLVSAALPDDSDDYGYYDGDGDDAVAAPERLAVLVDLAVSARGESTPIRISVAFEGSSDPIVRPVALQSPPPLLRSPPTT